MPADNARAILHHDHELQHFLHLRDGLPKVTRVLDLRGWEAKNVLRDLFSSSLWLSWLFGCGGFVARTIFVCRQCVTGFTLYTSSSRQR